MAVETLSMSRVVCYVGGVLHDSDLVQDNMRLHFERWEIVSDGRSTQEFLKQCTVQCAMMEDALNASQWVQEELRFANDNIRRYRVPWRYVRKLVEITITEETQWVKCTGKYDGRESWDENEQNWTWNPHELIQPEWSDDWNHEQAGQCCKLEFE